MRRRDFLAGTAGLITSPAWSAELLKPGTLLTPRGALAGQKVFASEFDGSTGYLNRGADLTGNADGKAGMFSCWFKLNADTANQFMYAATDSFPQTIKTDAGDSNRIRCQWRNAAVTVICDVRDLTGGRTVSAGWIHFVHSWDLAAGRNQLYLNGVVDETAKTTTNDTIDYTVSDHVIGANSGGGGGFWDGLIGQLYINMAESLDLSSNIAKFYNGGPVNMGSDGSLPTGNAPIIFMNGAPGVNTGTGGNFTVNGTVTASTDFPG